MRRITALALLLLVFPTAAIAAPLQMQPGPDIAFGEIAPGSNGMPGYFEINAATGASVTSNAFQIGTPSRGSFTLLGERLNPIILSLTSGAWTCDLAYAGPCVGAPTLTLTHDFPGMITSNNCPQQKRCQEPVNVGGRFSFTGTESGRWTTIITVIANYQ